MNTQEALLKIFELFDPASISFIIRYGSDRNNDIDLFIGLKYDCSYNSMQAKKLDLTFAGGQVVQNMAKHFDPLITEPLMTGELIFGKNVEH